VRMVLTGHQFARILALGSVRRLRTLAGPLMRLDFSLTGALQPGREAAVALAARYRACALLRWVALSAIGNETQRHRRQTRSAPALSLLLNQSLWPNH
jgi:hypothetical protein